ncbi:hypothetical protein ACFLYM_03205 [Chloroflexota bacterium]
MEKMKQCNIPIIVIVTLILGMFLISCTETVNVSAAERNKAVIFYKKLYPIIVELQQINDEWDEWNAQANQTKYESQIINKCDYLEANLLVLASKVGTLEAPPNLVYLHSSTFSAINSRSNVFALLKQYALTGNERYYRQAELNLSQSMKLMKQAANEYDKSLNKYGIKPFEITN